VPFTDAAQLVERHGGEVALLQVMLRDTPSRPTSGTAAPTARSGHAPPVGRASPAGVTNVGEATSPRLPNVAGSPEPRQRRTSPSALALHLLPAAELRSSRMPADAILTLGRDTTGRAVTHAGARLGV
jgi:hypothetical protein